MRATVLGAGSWDDGRAVVARNDTVLWRGTAPSPGRSARSTPTTGTSRGSRAAAPDATDDLETGGCRRLLVVGVPSHGFR
jgi:hypothetical protein